VTRPLPWFGVETLYRIVARGGPERVDAAYDADATLVEERVVLLRARSHASALASGEREARRYAATSHRNVYGQRVLTRYLGCAESFELFDPPAAGVEVFSTTEIVTRRVRTAAIAAARLGAERGVSRARRKFLDAETAGNWGLRRR
jgi:hypothetical protein